MRLFIAALLALSLHAAVVQGVVLDDETGNPLARTLVLLSPLPGTPAAALTLRTGERGAFSILSVRTGWYTLKTSRKGFADTEAGQLRAGRPGLPFEVTADTQSTFVQIRMRRLPAALGSVLDENSVGIPDWPVHLYTAKKPVRRVAEIKTDDRGNFRLGALDPGTYVVRAGAGVLDEYTSLLPTYYKYGTALSTAESFRLRLGDTAQDLTLRPVKGKLLEISGVLGPPYIPDTPEQLTLITDTGRRVIATGPGPFTATGVPPGPVELLVEGVRCGGYTRLLADKDISAVRAGCLRLEPTAVDWRMQDSPRPARAYPVTARRVDLDGTGPSRPLRPGEALAPGNWELMVEPSAEYYITSIRSLFSGEPATRNDGWFGLFLSNQARLSVMVSSRPAALSGVVSSGGKPVAGAAVYVELFGPDGRVQLWALRTSEQGKFILPGLSPGRYRTVSSFDFDSDDPFVMEKAVAIALKEGDSGNIAIEMNLP